MSGPKDQQLGGAIGSASIQTDSGSGSGLGGAGNPSFNTSGGDASGYDPYGGGGYSYGPADYGGGYGGYSGFGSGPSGDEGPTENQKKSAKNLQPIIHYNYDTLGKKYDLGDKVYDTADEQSKNMQDWQVATAGRNASGDWYRQQQKLQSAMKNMRDEMGNAAYGSDFIDMYEAFARADDQMDDDTLRAFRKNLEEIDANYYDAIMSNVNSRNKLAADTEISMRELLADWAAQLNNIHPDLATGSYDSIGGGNDDDTDGGIRDKRDPGFAEGGEGSSLGSLAQRRKVKEDSAALKKAYTVEKIKSLSNNESPADIDLSAITSRVLTTGKDSSSKDRSGDNDVIYAVEGEDGILGLIDQENDTLRAPKWFDTDFASKHWTDAIKPEMRPFYRPDLAAQTASDSGLRNRNTNTASAATRRAKGIASYLQPYSANSMNRRTQ